MASYWRSNPDGRKGIPYILLKQAIVGSPGFWLLGTISKCAACLKYAACCRMRSFSPWACRAANLAMQQLHPEAYPATSAYTRVPRFRG